MIAINYPSQLEKRNRAQKTCFLHLLQIQEVFCRCAASLLHNTSIACIAEFKNFILRLLVKFLVIISKKNWILQFAANFCNLQQICCMLVVYIKMQKSCFQKFFFTCTKRSLIVLIEKPQRYKT